MLTIQTWLDGYIFYEKMDCKKKKTRVCIVFLRTVDRNTSIAR